jgi:hypothetical protein
MVQRYFSNQLYPFHIMPNTPGKEIVVIPCKSEKEGMLLLSKKHVGARIVPINNMRVDIGRNLARKFRLK